MADLPRVLGGGSAEPAASPAEDETGEQPELAGAPDA
jgi:hypothetical protein